MNDEITILLNYAAAKTIESWLPSSWPSSHRHPKVGRLEEEVVLGSPLMIRPRDIFTKREIKVIHQPWNQLGHLKCCNVASNTSSSSSSKLQKPAVSTVRKDRKMKNHVLISSFCS
jgi:hypothetical protein